MIQYTIHSQGEFPTFVNGGKQISVRNLGNGRARAGLQQTIMIMHCQYMYVEIALTINTYRLEGGHHAWSLRSHDL